MGVFYDDESKRHWVVPNEWDCMAINRGLITFSGRWCGDYIFRTTRANYIFRKQPLLQQIELYKLNGGRKYEV